MAASDNLGGQFDREATRRTIPQHHHDAIRGAISHMGERGIELVPGGLHVTPSDGGKPQFFPHQDPTLWVTTEPHSSKEYDLTSQIPSEGHYANFGISNSNSLGFQSKRGLHPMHGTLKSALRESFDDPAHLMDRSHDTTLTESSSRNSGARNLVSWGDVDDPSRTYMSNWKNRDTAEVLDQLPHLGGNPKDPAHSLVSNSDHNSGMSSEDISATKGLLHAWSHVYDQDDFGFRNSQSTVPRPPKGRPVRSSERHTVAVHVSDGDNSTFYDYDTTTGHIRPSQLL